MVRRRTWLGRSQVAPPLQQDEGDPARQDRQPEGGDAVEEDGGHRHLAFDADGGEAGDERRLDGADAPRRRRRRADGGAQEEDDADAGDARRARAEGVHAEDEGRDVAEGEKDRAAEELGHLEGPPRDLADALSGAPQDGHDALAQHAAPGRQQEQEPGEREDDGEPDQHGLARGQEVEGADAAAPGPEQEDEGERDVHQKAGELLQADGRRGHGQIEALLLQVAHVDGHAARGAPARCG